MLTHDLKPSKRRILTELAEFDHSDRRKINNPGKSTPGKSSQAGSGSVLYLHLVTTCFLR